MQRSHVLCTVAGIVMLLLRGATSASAEDTEPRQLNSQTDGGAAEQRTTDTAANLPSSELVKAAAVHQLLAERAFWNARDTSALLPVTFTSLTVIAFGSALALAVDAANNRSHDGSKTAGIGCAVGGAISLLTSIYLWSARTSPDRRTDELRRIDGELGAMGFQATLLPWIAPIDRLQAMQGGVDWSIRF